MGKGNNPKIEYLNETGNKHKLEDKKYAFFEIKTNTNTTVYLYCSEVESFGDKDADLGIFEGTDHKSISIIACDTKNIEKMNMMFDGCRDLKKLEFGKNFNTENVRNMRCMFEMCSSLKNLDLLNFNTSKVKNKENMFDNCNNLPQDIINKILGKKNNPKINY